MKKKLEIARGDFKILRPGLPTLVVPTGALLVP